MRGIFWFFLMMPGQDPVLVSDRRKDLPAHFKVLLGERCHITHNLRLLGDQYLDLPGISRPVFCLRKNLRPFFGKFAPAFPYLADTVEAFFCIREYFEVLIVKFVAVPALEDEINLCFLNYLVFSGLGFLHSYTFTKSTMREKRIVVHAYLQISLKTEMQNRHAEESDRFLYFMVSFRR